MVFKYRIAKWLLIIISLLIGIHAFYGGINLILQPSGATLNLTEFLPKLPFGNDFFWYGIMLLCFNGFSQITTALLLLMHNNTGGVFAGFSAAILLVWISVQFFALGAFFYPVYHLILSISEIILSIIVIKNYKKIIE